MGNRLEITSFVGLLLGFTAVIGAMIFKHISFAVFINPAAFFVIFVGTAASVVNSYPGRDLKNLGKLFKVIFTQPNAGGGEIEIIKQLLELSEKARKEGILSIEAKVEGISDPFMKKALRMVVDAYDHELVMEMLLADIEAMNERHLSNAGIFSSAATYAPTLGVLGAVFGLIAAMGSITDTSIMAEAIAAAFIATILGIFTGYVIWMPMATKLKAKNKHEIAQKKVIIEGVLSIQKGESSKVIHDKLLSLLPLYMSEKFDGERHED
jgi:chemotaxis protein MotA